MNYELKKWVDTFCVKCASLKLHCNVVWLFEAFQHLLLIRSILDLFRYSPTCRHFTRQNKDTIPYKMTWHNIKSHHMTSNNITSHHMVSHHITSHHMISYHVTLHRIIWYQIASHHVMVENDMTEALCSPVVTFVKSRERLSDVLPQNISIFLILSMRISNVLASSQSL